MIPAITGLPVGPFATTTARESRTATPHTAARAVRMHGGGHATQVRRALQPAGRLLSLAGGDIDRRCEAASIFPSLPRASAGAYTPPTGVRRARHLGTPLRLGVRPHAQLVEGYERGRKAGQGGEV